MAATFVVVRHDRRPLWCQRIRVDSRVSAPIVQLVFTAMYQQAYVPLFDALPVPFTFSRIPFVVGQPVGATVVVGDSLLE